VLRWTDNDWKVSVWPEETGDVAEWQGDVAQLREPIRPRRSACILCGRNDHLEDGVVRPKGFRGGGDGDDLGVPEGAYLRVLELAKALMFHDDDGEACKAILKTWRPSRTTGGGHRGQSENSKERTVPVGEAVRILHEGTYSKEIFGLLSRRLNTFERFWLDKGADGLNFALSADAQQQVRTAAGGGGAV
jgi:hypothetical protein